MKIKEIITQCKRDLELIYICEHCGFEFQSYGYDDVYFYNEIIPKMQCPKCKKISAKSSEIYIPKVQTYDKFYNMV